MNIHRVFYFARFSMASRPVRIDRGISLESRHGRHQNMIASDQRKRLKSAAKAGKLTATVTATATATATGHFHEV